MEEQLFYSIVLLVSMMFLCLMIPPAPKQKIEEEVEDDLRS